MPACLCVCDCVLRLVRRRENTIMRKINNRREEKRSNIYIYFDLSSKNPPCLFFALKSIMSLINVPNKKERKVPVGDLMT